jgi:hypothetical protein
MVVVPVFAFMDLDTINYVLEIFLVDFNITNTKIYDNMLQILIFLIEILEEPYLTM